MSKHTPGPWQPMPTDASIDDDQGLDGDGQRMGTWAGIGNPELTNGIVALAVFDGRYDEPEFDANIALIAAAPELLAALGEVMDWISNWSPDFVFDEEWAATDERVHAAIAKAQGDA